MSVRISTLIWNDPSLKTTLGEFVVLLALADYSNHAGESWPTIPALAQKAHLSERAVQRAIRKLEKLGILRVNFADGRGESNHYIINLDCKEIRQTGQQSDLEKGDANVTLFMGDISARVTMETGRGDNGSVKGDNGGTHHIQDPSLTVSTDPSSIVSDLFSGLVVSDKAKIAFKEYKDHRKEIRHSLTPRAEARVLKWLKDWGEPAWLEAIDNAITGGWRGLFKPTRHNGNGNGHHFVPESKSIQEQIDVPSL